MRIDNDLRGKLVAGYQAWFRASPDLDKGWIHWSRDKAPSQTKTAVEMYPDTRDYPDSVLYRSGFPPLGNGGESLLFASRTEEVIDLHFSWAERYGVDCLALQRFYSEVVPERVVSHYDSDHLQMVRRAAERHSTLFYVMYDFSGAAPDGLNTAERTGQDWIIQVEESGLLDSPNYACRNGKKIVCLWGLTGLDQRRYPNAKTALAMVRWFQERGYYVIGGFPDNDWARVTDDYAELYRAVDMASPWTVGRFKPGKARVWWEPVYQRERSYCDEHNIEYMPVAFPGFSWCNFNAGPANDFPRQAGAFFWEQLAFLREQGVDTLYLAMFDEYDEGTAFIKAAEDSSMLPGKDHYFQTLSADGLWLSSDFYLRLAGAARSVLRGETAMTESPPIEHSLGPVYWRNGFERRGYVNRTTKQPEEANVDVCLYEDGTVEGDITAEIVESGIGSGRYALRLCGAGLYKIASAKISCAEPFVFTWISDSDSIRMAVLLEDGGTVTAGKDEAFTAESLITGIAVQSTGGECWIDDIELRRKG